MPPATEWDGPCPVGMAIVDGGILPKKQRERWQKFYYSREKVEAPSEVAAFCLDLYETTEADYLKCGTECAPLRAKPRTLHARGDSSMHPLLNVNQKFAATYCASLGKRLPTLGEWLWAAGGGAEDRKYPWGAQPPSIERFNGCDYACARIKMEDCGGEERGCTERKMADVHGEDGYGETAPVGSFPAGAGRWGHFDLAGNAMELVAGVGTRVWWCGSSHRGYAPASLHAENHCSADYIIDEIDGLRCAAAPRITDPPR